MHLAPIQSKKKSVEMSESESETLLGLQNATRINIYIFKTDNISSNISNNTSNNTNKGANGRRN